MTLFLIIFFITVILILSIDAFTQFYTWQSRIKIGRFNTEVDWHHKVLKKSQKWLVKTPVIKLTDNNRLTIIDMLKGNYQRSAIQAWQEAALVLGLSSRYLKTRDAAIKLEIEQFFISKTTAEGGWKIKPTEADHAILAYALLNADFLDAYRYKKAMDETYQMILSLKGDDGTVSYKKHTADVRFVDTVGFICPFLTAYGLLFKKPEAVDLAVLQILEFKRHGMLNERSIPCHTYQVATKLPIGLFGWGRGLGWFVIGLIDTWHTLPPDHAAREELENIIIDTVHSSIEFQNEKGGFHWLLFDRRTRLDSSTAATLALFYTLAASIPEISEICHAARAKCLHYLQSVTRRNGAIDFSQGDTKGIGVYSQNFDILPFTQGFVLRTLNTPIQ